MARPSQTEVAYVQTFGRSCPDFCKIARRGEKLCKISGESGEIT